MRKKKANSNPAKKLDRQRKKFLRIRFDSESKGQPRLTDLRQRLLRIAGEEICARPEPHIEEILTRGREWPTRHRKVEGGEPNHCHANVATLWSKNPDQLAIVIGYALADDNVWRQHTWAWSMISERIVETTRPFRDYFGFQMNDEEASRFAMANAESKEVKKKIASHFVTSQPREVPAERRA